MRYLENLYKNLSYVNFNIIKDLAAEKLPFHDMMQK